MKKIILSLILIVAMAICAGCGGSNLEPVDTKFLTNTEYWWHYDEVTGESEKMSFHEDGTFYWGCECGEPVGDSDLYELFSYDQETKTIVLYNDYDANSIEMKVLNYSDYHLMLEINGEIKDYTCENVMKDEPRLENSEEYMGGYSMIATIIQCDGTEIVVGPFNYDGDVEYPDNAFASYTLAENVQFHDLNVTTVQKVDEGTETQEVEYNEMTQDEGVAVFDYGSAYAFIWFNEAMDVEKITFYGATIIQE